MTIDKDHEEITSALRSHVISDTLYGNYSDSEREKISNEEIFDTALRLRGDEVDSLAACFTAGPLFDGNLPSKNGRNLLMDKGAIVKVVVKGDDGFNACSHRGAWIYRCRKGILRTAQKIRDYRLQLASEAKATGADHLDMGLCCAVHFKIDGNVFSREVLRLFMEETIISPLDPRIAEEVEPFVRYGFIRAPLPEDDMHFPLSCCDGNALVLGVKAVELAKRLESLDAGTDRQSV